MLFERHLPTEWMLSRQGVLKFKDTNKWLFINYIQMYIQFLTLFFFYFIIQILNLLIAADSLHALFY